MLADVENLDNVGVLQPRVGQGLGAKAGQALAAAAEEEFQRHRTVQTHVPGPVNHGHAAFAQKPQDLVTGHGRKVRGRTRGRRRPAAAPVPGRFRITQGGQRRVGPALQPVQNSIARRASFQVPADGFQSRLRQIPDVKGGQVLLRRAIAAAHAGLLRAAGPGKSFHQPIPYPIITPL